MADSTRLAVLELLWSGPKHVGEMNAVLGLEQSLLSHHLKVLREEGFIRAIRDGKAVLYQLESGVQRASGGRAIDLGLFGNAFFCKTLGMGFSILSGGLTLACMVLPILIRATQEGFRAVPDDYRRSGAALGISRTAILWELLLPAAMPGVVVGLLLGLGRAIAETAALIFTSGYVERMPESIWDSGRSLSVHIYDLAMNVSGGETHAYASAVVLVSFLVLINSRSFRLWQN